MNIEPIAFFHSPMTSKFGIPRQSGLVPGLEGKLVFEKDFRIPEAVKGLEDFDFLWLIWGFSENIKTEEAENWKPMVRPPRLGGNKRVGVFASRSPFRPNHLGLSSVKIDHLAFDEEKGPVIYVRGADLMDGSPIYDIKPYISYCDSHPEAFSGFVSREGWRTLEVIFPENLRKDVEDAGIIIELLSQDPRPSYQDSPERVYGMEYKGMDIRFTVKDRTLTVIEVK